MANIKANPALKRYNNETQFRFVKNIESMSDEELNDYGYYYGYPCPHGHVIRDKEQHWCYHCVLKIISNNCGFDINFIDQLYKLKYFKLWSQVQVGDWDSCWEGPRKMVSFPSYRSAYTTKKTENVSFHKAIYQCAWGDIGKGYVTRGCGNKNCVNPLHLVSNWNRFNPPKIIYPFIKEFEADKLMLFGKRIITEISMRPTISHPQDVLDQ